MTGPAWSRVEELFHAALERAPAEREGFLREACGGTKECGARSSRCSHRSTRPGG